VAILRLLPHERTPIASNIVFFRIRVLATFASARTSLLGRGGLLTDVESLLRSYDSAPSGRQPVYQQVLKGVKVFQKSKSRQPIQCSKSWNLSSLLQFSQVAAISQELGLSPSMSGDLRYQIAVRD